MKNTVLVLFLLLSHCHISGQDISEEGLPLVKNYSPEEYDAFDQNWAACQDTLGILYFANGDGVLSYNGVDWGLVELPNKATVFTVQVDNSGQIYVGAFDELGLLEPNSKGELVYISLKSLLQEEFKDFGAIRTIRDTKHGIFFLSKKYIFIWNGEEFDCRDNFGDSNLFCPDSRVLKRTKDQGLMEFSNNKFELIEGGTFFADKKIYSILPYDDRSLLIATKNKLYLYTDSEIKEFKTNAPDYFLNNVVYKGVVLGDGIFALGSLNKGILIIDRHGRTRVILSEDNLLRHNGVLGLFRDKSGLLWASLYSGISKIEYSTAFSFFNEHNQTPQIVLSFSRYNGVLFIGGSDGLFYLRNDQKENPYFKRVEGEFGTVKEIILFNNKMLVGSTSGLYEVDDEMNVHKILGMPMNTMVRSSRDTNRIYLGGERSLISIKNENNTWEVEEKFDEVKTFVDRIVETEGGDLWLGVDRNELIHVSLSDTRALKNPVVQLYTPQNGLPDKRGLPYIINDKVYFIAGRTVYSYDSSSDLFVKDSILYISMGLDPDKVELHYVDQDARLWFIEYNDDDERVDQIIASPREDGSYELVYLKEARIMDLRSSRLFEEFGDSVVWYKAKKGIIRHVLTGNVKTSTGDFNTIITSVVWSSDSMLRSTYGSPLEAKLPFQSSQIRFNYSSNSFNDESRNKYQYQLVGFDEAWSSWSLENKKDYTNISEGNYQFNVRTKNILDEVSKEDSYLFTIMPPWYRTWWMYVLYVLGVLGVINLISQRRSKELTRRNELLESEVDNRTAEINQKNQILMLQTEKLFELDNAKTQLYSNITHEFRTPLTVILGMTDELKENIKKMKLEGVEKSLELIERNGKELLHLVIEMLDLAKVESGKMDLQLRQADIVPLVTYLIESFSSLAEQNGVHLSFHSEVDSLEMDFDAIKISSIISNLISNAIKFTPEKGRVVVHIEQVIRNDKEFLSIKVKDSGMGISENDIPNIFNRFYRSEGSSRQGIKGTGIGLALTKELVTLMKGTIVLKSDINEGSEFEVLLPVLRNTPKGRELDIHPESKSLISDPGKTEEGLSTMGTELPLALIIEDNMDVAYYLRTSLGGKYDTMHAVNGEDGIQMAIENIPDIIICDVVMPKKDGYEVCATLKSDERTDHIPIIILTAKVAIEDRLTGLARGADAYLEKPFNKNELFTRLDQLVLLRRKLIGKIQKEGYHSYLERKDDDPQIQFLQKVVSLIHEELGNSEFGATDLSKRLLASDSQVYRKIKAITGRSTAVFIRSIRLQHARELLRSTAKSVSEVAYEVGFNDPSWFSRAFKEEFGISPNSVSK